MARHKKNAALFEVITRNNAKGLEPPSWIVRDQSATGAATRASTELKQPPGLDGNHPAPRTPATGEPIAYVADGRLRLNLGYVSCLVIGLGLIVLLVAAYQIGSHAGGSSDSGQATGAEMSMFTNGDEPLSAYDYDTAQAAAAELLVGRSEALIIQDGLASAEDAMAVHRYLWSKGFRPWVAQSDGRIAVVDTVDVSTLTEDDLEARQQMFARLGADKQWHMGSKYDFSRLQKVSLSPTGSAD